MAYEFKDQKGGTVACEIRSRFSEKMSSCWEGDGKKARFVVFASVGVGEPAKRHLYIHLRIGVLVG